MSAEGDNAGMNVGSDFVEPGEAEKTLRLIANLPAPEELAERVRGGLRAAQNVTRRADGRVLQWPSRSGGAREWLRGAAAAAIVCVVAGGAWWIYASAPPAAGSAVTAPVHVRPAGGFSSASAIHTPDTLKGPVLTHEAQKKTEPAKKDVQTGNAGGKAATQPN
jgi:hypothetical protein